MKSKEAHREYMREAQKRYNRRMRERAHEMLGKVCACCGDDREYFMTIDHINNDGAEHRRQISPSGAALTRWIVKNGTDGFQLLCANCHLAKTRLGTCPCQDQPVRVHASDAHCERSRPHGTLSAMPSQEDYRRWRAAGLCGGCGSRPPVEGKAQCEVCRNRRNHYGWKTRKDRGRRYREKLRSDVFDHYGWACACCGESGPLFLTIDHINGGGAEHRRTFGNGSGVYAWLRREGFPDGYQTLCINCNLGRSRNGGVCPHRSHVEDLPT